MSTPDTSLNRSSSSPGDLKLIIKAANQKYEDFVIDNFELDWTIKQLKQYLFENYPQKPEISTVRLIYSGKMLHDHWTLSECIRHNSQVKSYIIHLVHSGTTRKEEVTSSPNVTTAQTDVDNELTPDTSSMSTSSSSSSSSSSLASTPLPANTNFVDQSFSRIQRDLNNLYQEQIQEQQSLLTPKQQYEQMLSKYVRYYESNGVSVQENAWYSSYIQHLALYNQMYSNYIQSQNAQFNIRGSNLAAGTSNQSFTEFQSRDNNSVPTPASAQQPNQMNNPDNQDQAQQQPDQEPQPPRPAPVPQAQPDGDREDDWLSLLHNAVSFIVLFSIIYYYSSLERFLVIFSIVIILILYHNGWLTLQRRQVAPRQDARPAQPDNPDEPQAADNNTSEQERQQQESNIPNSFRLFVSFVLTFFTSLIPERPRIAAN